MFRQLGSHSESVGRSRREISGHHRVSRTFSARCLSLTHPPNHSPTHSLTHCKVSFSHSLTHSSTHTLTHPIAHQLTYSLSPLTLRKKHKAAVLSLAIPQPNSLVTCNVDKHVREFDLRTPVSLVAEHCVHRRSVLALACSEQCVYSGGEEGSVCVWDRRSRQVLQTLKVSSSYTIYQLCNIALTLYHTL